MREFVRKDDRKFVIGRLLGETQAYLNDASIGQGPDAAVGDDLDQSAAFRGRSQAYHPRRSGMFDREAQGAVRSLGGKQGICRIA